MKECATNEVTTDGRGATGRGHVREVPLFLPSFLPSFFPSCLLLRRQFNYRDAQMRSEDFPAAAAVICRSVRKMFALARSAAALLFMHLNVGKKHFRGILRTLLRTRVQRYGMVWYVRMCVCVLQLHQEVHKPYALVFG